LFLFPFPLHLLLGFFSFRCRASAVPQAINSCYFFRSNHFQFSPVFFIKIIKQKFCKI
jgi:hypothetical protein